MHVFYLESSEEWFVASSAEDAWKLALELWGGQKSDYDDDGEDDFVQCPDDAELTINVADEDDPPEKLSLTCAGWVKRNGRGHLCSVDY